MDIQEIIERSYQATVKRGLITPNTGRKEFIKKLYEEVYEVSESKTIKEDAEELADVVLVCFAMAKHFKIDLLRSMELKMLYNEKRKD